jgi:hypothetical protein
MLDDHATDSNHKKNVGIVRWLSSSLRWPVDMSDHARTYYCGLTDQARPIAVDKWRKDIEEAERARLDDITAMDIYATQVRLAENASQHATHGRTGSALEHWINLALTVEEKQ